MAREVWCVAALAALTGACGGPVPTTATVSLGIVPADVETVSVFVVDGAEVIATSTLTPPSVRVALGVPAEVPLVFHAVARSDRPAPPALGGRMPAYVARSVRTIPLGREVVGVPLEARPGGGLTFTLGGPEGAGDRIRLRLESPVEARPRTWVARAEGARASYALPSGRWSLDSEDPDWVVVGGAGLWVAPSQESVARPSLAPTPARPAMDAPARVALTVRTGGAPVPPGAAVTATAALTLALEAFDAREAPVPAPLAELEVRLRSTPAGLWSEAIIEARGLPAEVGPLEIDGAGRLEIDVEARLTDGRRLRATWYGNAGGVGGPPASLLAELSRPADLAAGAEVRLALLDAAGQFAAAAPWTADLSDSAPWVFLPEGPAVESVTPRVVVPVARPSGPRGLSVDFRAVATSTAFVGTYTATVTLPMVSEVTP